MRPAVCHSCRKVTYAGCGNHAAQVLASVPAHQRGATADEPTAGGAGWLPTEKSANPVRRTPSWATKSR